MNLAYFRKSVVIALFSFVLFSHSDAQAASAPKEPRSLVQECQKILVKGVKPQKVADHPTVLSLAQAATKLIVKNHKVPTQAELAVAMKTTPTDIRTLFKKLPGISSMEELVLFAQKQFPSDFDRSRAFMLKKAGFFVKTRSRVPNREELAQLTGTPTAQLDSVYGEIGDLFALIKDQRASDIEIARNRVITKFTKLARMFGRVPEESELAKELGVSTDEFKHFFGKKRPFKNFEDLVAVAFVGNPSTLSNVINTEIFSEERAEKMIQAIRKSKVILETTAVAGHRLHKEALAAMLKYCEENDGIIVIYPANLQTTGLPQELLDHPRIHILTHTVDLNPTIRLHNIKILAKMIDPLQGLDELGTRGQSLIIGSPQFRQKVIHTLDNDVFHHVLMTTGAITYPDYNSQKYVQGRNDERAAVKHKIGAVVIEKSDGENLFPFVGSIRGEFNTRHIEYNEKNKGFVDVGNLYTGTEVKPTRPLAIALGDIHVGVTYQPLLKAFKEQLLALKPREVVLHDLLDGYSISHHEKNRLITMAKKAANGELNLKEELENVISFINSILAADPELAISIVHSNHNFWLVRWLQEKSYIEDPVNAKIGHLLWSIAEQGLDPLEVVLKHGLKTTHPVTDEVSYLIMPVSNEQRVQFTHPGESKKVGLSRKERQIELALHGHAGAAGMRGAGKTFVRGTNGVARGHTHTIGRDGDDVNQGGFVPLRVGYSSDGLSNWVQAANVIWEDTSQQVLVYRDGEFYATHNSKPLKPEEFFPEGYPKLKPNNDRPPGPGDFDQYGGSGSTRGK